MDVGPARARHAIDVVEAGYALEGTDREWLTNVLAAAQPDFDFGAGAYAFTARLEGESMVPDGLFVERELDHRLFEVVAKLNQDLPPELVRTWARRASAAGTVMSFFGEGSMGVRRLHETAGEGSAVDGFAWLAQDGEGNALTLAGLSRASIRYAPRIGAIWRRVGLHVVAGWRLRRHLASHAEASPDAPEALVTPGGKLVDARGVAAEDASLRRRIVEAAKSVDRARTKAVRADPAAALDLWQGLVAGRWSLVDHWESDGKRYLAALRNEPSVPDPRALSPRERAVVHYAWLAASNKEIAFVLGLSVDAVASALSSALRKLGYQRRSDLAALGDPKHWQTTRIDAGGQELELLEASAQPKPTAVASLTPAERAVAELVLEGKTNAAIAKARRTSINTVVNQVRAIYTKLGVRSRSELARALR